jgi:predicted transcriptional regulator
MPEELSPGSLDRELTANIVTAYVRRNQIGPEQLATLISTVHQTLSRTPKTGSRNRD